MTTASDVLAGNARWAVECGDCLSWLRSLPDASVDAVVTDPPYPEIDRPYGRMSEAEWAALMDSVVGECRRVLTPTGSAVFVLQPNSERVGRMRPWLWEFAAKWARQWNMPQDAYWWNPTAPPTVHCREANGLMRPSLKFCVWLGSETCWRDQGAVLWRPSDAALAADRSDRALARMPSGLTMRVGRCAAAADRRGGVTPFNLVPIPNADSVNSAGARGHGAGTPLELCRWWVRYICPPGGVVCEPFAGSGTVAEAALTEGRRCVMAEKEPDYLPIIRRRMTTVTPSLVGG